MFVEARSGRGGGCGGGWRGMMRRPMVEDGLYSCARVCGYTHLDPTV